jgi:Nickel responsive protein SCO4226-like
MPMFVVERQFAEQFDPDEATLQLVDQYHADHDIRWLTSFLSADKKRTYCLYECADIEVLRRHAADLGLPADAITEVSEFAR